MRRLPALFTAAAVLVVGSVMAGSGSVPAGAVEVTEITSTAEAGLPVRPEASIPDTVSMSESRDLSAPVAAAAVAAAAAAGAQSAVVHSGVLKMTRVMRGEQVVQAAPLRYAYPMWSAAVDPGVIGTLWGADVAEVLSSGAIVMGATSAGLRGAVAGDEIDVQGWNGTMVRLRIGMVAPDDAAGGAELMLASRTAASMGFVRPSRVVMWGFADRDTIDAAVDAALEAGGLRTAEVRVRRSWDAPDPDAQLSLVRTKALLGEFAYRSYGSRVVVHRGWVAEHLPTRREVLDPTIRIRALCHVVVREAIRGALADAAAAGLAGAIDVYETNRWGGCFNPRLIRSLGRDVGGLLSRHTWAMAIDLNVRTNRLGAAPQLDCRVVRIFRRWGFAWGGNFVTPDGMHFEYVGERRDLLAYPSKFCPNEPPTEANPAPDDAGATGATTSTVPVAADPVTDPTVSPPPVTAATTG